MMSGGRENQSVSSGILYLLLIKRKILDSKALSPESPCGGSFLPFPLLPCSLIKKLICIVDLTASILLVQGQK